MHQYLGICDQEIVHMYLYIFVYMFTWFGSFVLMAYQLMAVCILDTEWSILKKSNTPNSFDDRCNLCLEEKIHILTHKCPDKLLNKRSELIARCRYKTKFKL